MGADLHPVPCTDVLSQIDWYWTRHDARTVSRESLSQGYRLRYISRSQAFPYDGGGDVGRLVSSYFLVAHKVVQHTTCWALHLRLHWRVLLGALDWSLYIRRRLWIRVDYHLHLRQLLHCR